MRSSLRTVCAIWNSHLLSGRHELQGSKPNSLFQRPAGSAISITATIVNVAAIAIAGATRTSADLATSTASPYSTAPIVAPIAVSYTSTILPTGGPLRRALQFATSRIVTTVRLLRR